MMFYKSCCAAFMYGPVNYVLFVREMMTELQKDEVLPDTSEVDVCALDIILLQKNESTRPSIVYTMSDIF